MLSRLLVIDDDVKIVRSMVAIAATRGYTSLGVSSPRDIATRVRDFRPGIIVLDLRLGRHDGRDVLRRIKTCADTADTIVVIASAVMDPFTIDLCRDYGAADYLCKPFYPSELFDRLERLKRDRRS